MSNMSRFEDHLDQDYFFFTFIFRNPPLVESFVVFLCNFFFKRLGYVSVGTPEVREVRTQNSKLKTQQSTQQQHDEFIKFVYLISPLRITVVFIYREFMTVGK